MKRLVASVSLGLIFVSFASFGVAQSVTTGANHGTGVGSEWRRDGERSAMGNVGCDALALLTLVLGIAVGAVLTYIPFAFRITTLRRRIERLKSSVG